MSDRTIPVRLDLLVMVKVDSWADAYDITPGQVRAHAQAAFIDNIRDLVEVESVQNNMF